MQKMNNILELYGKDESFTQSEKNLLLDYNQKIREAIAAIQVDDSEEVLPKNNPASSNKKEDSIPIKSNDKAVETISKPAIENNHTAKSVSNKYAEIFHFKKAEDLSEKLEATPIDNIQKAMGLNERILTQNELFRGDKDSFDSTVKKLNGLNSFDEARNYLSEEIIPQYDWAHEDRLKKAQEFIKLIRRKY